MTRIRDLQKRANDLFLEAGEAEARGDTPAAVRFSPFVPEHVDGALELVDRWIKLTDEGKGNDGSPRRSRTPSGSSGPTPNARSTR
jgi:hypothetical protein